MEKPDSEGTPTESFLPTRKLVCLVIGVEIEASNMTALRQQAQNIVNEQGDPRDGPYHIWVCEGATKIAEFALCHPDKKREHMSRTVTG